MHLFTAEEAHFIKANAANCPNAEMTEIFNNHFNLQLGVNQIKAYKKNHNISSGLDGRYAPGNTPINKGQKGIHLSPASEFKKGNRPWNYKPVGTERINADGYWDVKIADPKKWRQKHILVWEAANGPVPKNKVVLFGDGNPLNCTLENLLLISRRELLVMNHRGLIKNDADLTRSGILIANIVMQLSDRQKGLKKRGKK